MEEVGRINRDRVGSWGGLIFIGGRMLVSDTMLEYRCAKCRLGRITGYKEAASLRYHKIQEKQYICVGCNKPMHLRRAIFKIIHEDVFLGMFE